MEDFADAIFDLLLRWLKRRRYVIAFIVLTLIVLTAVIYLLVTA